jgi:hypothetical protein
MKIFYTDTILLDLQQSRFATNFQKDHFIIKLAEKIANNFEATEKVTDLQC